MVTTTDKEFPFYISYVIIIFNSCQKNIYAKLFMYFRIFTYAICKISGKNNMIQFLKLTLKN